MNDDDQAFQWTPSVHPFLEYGPAGEHGWFTQGPHYGNLEEADPTMGFWGTEAEAAQAIAETAAELAVPVLIRNSESPDTVGTAPNPLLFDLHKAFSALGDDPDYLADIVAGHAGLDQAERLRDLFQAVGALLDWATD